ncbi:folate receptor gamma-like isoform X2 [Babylonia areolata]|uniref:folate receptor gamma-like isoform X2 n=1 Tax=Babylonia areolata TaxID=304850 RepID=UPI003FCFCC49
MKRVTGELFAEFTCSPWAKRSCCTEESSQGMAFDRTWLNFDWHHCGPLSPECTQHFVKDLCFYECSPNIGPYIVPDVRKIRNQRYVNVPMCQRTCNAWWEACKSDLTCIDNWTQNFNWSTGINKCPTGTKCSTFETIFEDAKGFCEGVWDHGFKVVPDTEGCFRLWFSDGENPNEAVARRDAARLLGLSGSAGVTTSAHRVVFFAFCFFLCFFL